MLSYLLLTRGHSTARMMLSLPCDNSNEDDMDNWNPQLGLNLGLLVVTSWHDVLRLLGDDEDHDEDLHLLQHDLHLH